LNTDNKIPQRLGECKLYKGITNYAYNKYWGSTNYIYNKYWGSTNTGEYLLYTIPVPEKSKPVWIYWSKRSEWQWR